MNHERIGLAIIALVLAIGLAGCSASGMPYELGDQHPGVAVSDAEIAWWLGQEIASRFTRLLGDPFGTVTLWLAAEEFWILDAAPSRGSSTSR